jgi:hypothetical protein
MGAVDLFRMAVPAIIIPIAVFVANWIYRSNKKYSKTAAGDFILAVLIFDGGAVTSSDQFQPFIKDPLLRTIVIDWHVCAAIVGGLLWAAILKWGEPRVANYYKVDPPWRQDFPFIAFSLCWMGVLILVAAQVSFFVIKG